MSCCRSICAPKTLLTVFYSGTSPSLDERELAERGNILGCFSGGMSTQRIINRTPIDINYALIQPNLTPYPPQFIAWPGDDQMQWRAWRDTTRDSLHRVVVQVHVQVRSSSDVDRPFIIRHRPLGGATRADQIRLVARPHDTLLETWGQTRCWSGLIQFGEPVPSFELQLD